MPCFRSRALYFLVYVLFPCLISYFGEEMVFWHPALGPKHFLPNIDIFVTPTCVNRNPNKMGRGRPSKLTGGSQGRKHQYNLEPNLRTSRYDNYGKSRLYWRLISLYCLLVTSLTPSTILPDLSLFKYTNSQGNLPQYLLQNINQQDDIWEILPS